MYSLRKSAFTIIELLVVILIIGLITTAAAASFLKAQQNARDNARKTTINAIAQAVEAYRFANQRYPALIAGKTAPNCLQNGTYFYRPNVTCDDTNTNDFGTSPNWIPGLSAYLNPPAIERNYLGSNGTSDSAPTFDDNGYPQGTSTLTNRTFSYVNTGNGYSIRARLEQPADSTQKDCSPANATSCNIYSITSITK